MLTWSAAAQTETETESARTTTRKAAAGARRLGIATGRKARRDPCAGSAGALSARRGEGGGGISEERPAAGRGAASRATHVRRRDGRRVKKRGGDGPTGPCPFRVSFPCHSRWAPLQRSSLPCRRRALPGSSISFQRKFSLV